MLFFSLFDKDEVAEKQSVESNKSNPLNVDRDEVSDFMLAIIV